MEMINYARTDAHYLLYIANCLVSELQTKAFDLAFLTFDFQQHVLLLACSVQSRVL
jgi:ribonuclease D